MLTWLSGDNVGEFITIAICLVMSAFFSAAETAITTLGTHKIKYLVKTKGQSVKHLQLWIDVPGRVLTTILIFNNGVNILASATATAMATRYFASQAIGIATGAITFLVLIFGEIIPKSFAKTHPESTAIFSMKIIRILEFLVRPLTKLLSGFADGVINAISEEDPNPSPLSEDELEFLVNESEKAGVIEDIKKDIIEGAFDFDETRVREIMKPRTDLAVVSTEDTFDDVLALCLETGHSRIPVYSESIDHIVGVVMAKDLLQKIADPDCIRTSVEIKDIMRDAFFAPESKSIMDVFKDLKRTKNHISIIIDEYGGTAGIVTMEDILEEIVGEIQDEFDSEEAKIRRVDNGIFDVLGSVTVTEFLEFFEIEESQTEESAAEAETVGGWMTELIADMPKVGQTVRVGYLKLEVTEIDRHRVDQIRVVKLEPDDTKPISTSTPA